MPHGKLGGKITAADHLKHGDKRSWLDIPEKERVQLVRQVLREAGMLTPKSGFVK
jgi:hypothetical protein